MDAHCPDMKYPKKGMGQRYRHQKIPAYFAD
jgi:hypothetical protein